MKPYIFLAATGLISNICLAQFPTWEVANDRGVGWGVIRDQSTGIAGNPPGSGTGSFFSFQSFNAAGQLGDWALINGGLVDKTAGKEQGDIDFVSVVDGKPSGFVFQGKYQGWGAAVLPVNDNELDLGRPTARWKNLMISGAIFVSAAKCPAALKRNQKSCIQFIVDGVPLIVPAY
jgi:hypothetical protein